jgi:hypothetical protein
MPLQFNTAPYYDDYDAAKKFYEILIRPGYAVQARELTQLQSIFGEQLNRIGQYIFKNGAMVTPGQITYDQNLAYVKVNLTYSSIPVDFDLIDPLVVGTNVQIKGATTGIVAQVVQVERSVGTLYVKYVTSGTSNTVATFADNEVINILPGNTGVCQAITTASTGVTAQASIDNGIYFIFGKFLNVDSQTIRLADYNQFPSVNVGLEAVETIVTPEDDVTLNDNANGTPNYAAPGAHRYKIVLNLVALPAGTVSDSEFTSLMVITNGTIQAQVQVTALSEIADTLARRTYDANGNFITTPFGFDIHESLLNGDNGGIYTSGQGGQEAQLAFGIEPGKAYVQGYEIKTIAKQFIPLDKARTTNFFQNSHTRAYLGNYIYINELFGLPSYDTWPSVNLYATPIVTAGLAPSTTIVGTATIRGLQFQEGSFQAIGDPGPIFECYLTDINITAPNTSLTDIRSLAVNDGTLTTTANILTQVDIVNVVGSFAIGSTITAGTLTEKVYAWDTTNNMLLTLPATTSIPVNSPITSSATGSANILQRIALFDPADNILLYQLPQNTVSTVRDNTSAITTSYSYRKVFTPVAASLGKVTFVTSTNEVFSSMDVTDYVATIESGTGAGTLIDVTSQSPIFTSGLSQITFNATNGTTVKLSATVDKSVAAEKAKSLQTQTLAVTSPVGILNLGHADIYSLDGVWKGTDDTGVDITSWFILDKGQRDNRYDFGTLTLLPGYSLPSSIFIQYKYFSHSSGDYFSVNSYLNFDAALPNYIAGVTYYPLIPNYGGSNGTIYFLRDCFDFRPRVDDSATWTSAIANATVQTPPIYVTPGKLVKPNDDIVSDFSYYLARIDKVYLDENGNFKVIEGTPSLAPLAPPDPSSGMIVAVLAYPPYTFSPKNVSIKTIQNKVYPMAKIGDLEGRIANLEYYNALNLLEQKTANMQIPDATTGLNRYQSGFVVDNFVDNTVSDYTNPDCHFSLDAPNNIMRPTYDTNEIKLGFDAIQSSNVELNINKTTNTIITLPYVQAPVITQPMASRQENLNPYNVFQFVGSLTLNPSTDTWVSITYLPDITITGSSPYSATQVPSNNTLGTVWDSWTTDWVGIPSVVTQQYSSDQGIAPGATAGISPFGVIGGVAITEEWMLQLANQQNVSQGSIVSFPISAITTTTDHQSRTGTKTTLVNVPTTTVNGDVTVNTGIVPYCRANVITFIAKGLKPFTQFWPFLDITPVGAYCTPSPLVTDANGMVTGTFNLPDPTVSGDPSFRTGTRVFKLCNDVNNVAANISSYATANYIASGVLDTNQRSVTSVMTPEVQTQTVSDTRTIDQVTTTQVGSVPILYIDPLAQAVLVGTLQGGFCVTSLDVYFATKDANIPVTLQIREMQNGTPTQSVVPFSTVVLNPNQINVSNDATALTNFSFPSPVYLQQGVEYGLVLMSNSNGYFLWTALMGDYVLNTDILISQVPYTGSMFKSQNASTWVPAPAEAWKFTLYRAVFDYQVLGKAIVENPVLPVTYLPDLSLVTYSGLNAVRIETSVCHGMPVGSLVTITIPAGAGNANWAASYNGIAVTSIVPTTDGDMRSSGIADTVHGSRTYVVGNVELDSFTIFIVDGSGNPVNASASGLTGVELTITQNYPYDVMMPIVNELNFSGTNTNYYVRGITETSIHGTQQPYQRTSLSSFPFTQFIPNQNLILTAPQLVASAINEAQLINKGTAFSNKSLVWEIDLTSSCDNLSPMIDSTRLSALLISNQIDFRRDATTPPSSPAGAAAAWITEIAPYGATNSAIYITRPVSLVNAANSIHFWLTIMWPYGAQVDVYYKILPTNTNTTFAAENYVLMAPDPNTDFSPAQNLSDFKDYYWTSTPNPNPTNLTDNVGEFTQFAIKIVMRSTNSSAVPLCKQLRVIALET